MLSEFVVIASCHLGAPLVLCLLEKQSPLFSSTQSKQAGTYKGGSVRSHPLKHSLFLLQLLNTLPCQSVVSQEKLIHLSVQDSCLRARGTVCLFFQNNSNNLNTVSIRCGFWSNVSLFCSVDTWVCGCGVGGDAILSKQAIKTYRETSVQPHFFRMFHLGTAGKEQAGGCH